jgi:hypothetical protein
MSTDPAHVPDRLGLLDRLILHCEIDTACLIYPQGEKSGTGWVQGAEDVCSCLRPVLPRQCSGSTQVRGPT